MRRYLYACILPLLAIAVFYFGFYLPYVKTEAAIAAVTRYTQAALQDAAQTAPRVTVVDASGTWNEPDLTRHGDTSSAVYQEMLLQLHSDRDVPGCKVTNWYVSEVFDGDIVASMTVNVPILPFWTVSRNVQVQVPVPRFAVTK